jgi:hypothetical protein
MAPPSGWCGASSFPGRGAEGSPIGAILRAADFAWVGGICGEVRSLSTARPWAPKLSREMDLRRGLDAL